MEIIHGFWTPPQYDYFPGVDYKHWFISVAPSASENLSKEQLINCYVQTLAKVLGSVEEANEKIYKVTRVTDWGLGVRSIGRSPLNYKICLKLPLQFPILMMFPSTKTMGVSLFLLNKCLFLLSSVG